MYLCYDMQGNVLGLVPHMEIGRASFAMMRTGQVTLETMDGDTSAIVYDNGQPIGHMEYICEMSEPGFL